MTLIEPDVALTDFGLAAECALFAAWLHWRGMARTPLRFWFVALFVALGIGALLGGVTHGFLGDGTTAARTVWIATLFAIAVAALACWAIGAHLIAADQRAQRIVAAAGVLLAINLATVFFVTQSFLVAVAFYVPAVLFVAAALLIAYARSRKAVLLPGLAGVVLTLIAAGIQQTGTGIAALNLTHNALYHVVQAVGLLLMFVTARHLAHGARVSDRDRAETASHVSRETN